MTESRERVIGGRFRIIRLIGKGGMGTVYEAQHLSLPRTYAIKILNRELARDRAFIERFRREAVAMSRIDHPNVIHITDYGQTDDGSVYLVMEYLEGVGLDDVLSQIVRLPVERALSILAQIADALEVAHQMDVVHRDLKPENVLLTQRHGRTDFVKLLDFGIAKVKSPEFDGTPLTIQGEVFGTAEYMSPEHATGRPVDGRSDIYALGCLAYELCSGQPPFIGPAVEILRSHVTKPPPSLSDRLRDIPVLPELDRLILRCLAKRPDERFQTCAELRQEILRVRALCTSLSEKMAINSRITGRQAELTDEQLTRGWQPLGARAPALLLPFRDSSVLLDSPRTAPHTQEPEAPPPAPRPPPDPRPLILALIRWGLADEELITCMERLMVVEEELVVIRGTLSGTRKDLERTQLLIAQKERPLRLAVRALGADLTQIRSRFRAGEALPRPLAEQVSDLTYQMSQLEQRCQEVRRDGEDQQIELRTEVEQLERHVTDLEQEQDALVEKARAALAEIRDLRSMPEEVRTLFARLEAHGGS